MTDWTDAARRLAETLTAALHPEVQPADAGGEAPGGDCRWCPLCQAAAVARGERPEVTEALADVLTATAQALRAYGAAPPPPGTPAGGDGAPEDGATGDGEPGDGATGDGAPGDDEDVPPPAVQRIELG